MRTKESVNRGKQLRFIRILRGLTQIKLCKETKGLSQANLSRFEEGWDNVISDDLLEKIMEKLNFPIGFLDRKSPQFDFLGRKTA